MNILDELAQKAVISVMQFQEKQAMRYYIQMYKEIKNNPSLLKSISNNYNTAIGLTSILETNIYSDIDERQCIASIAYLLISKYIKENPSNADAYETRLIILIKHDDAFNYTIMNVFGGNSILSFIDPLSGLKKRDTNHKMRFADFQKCINNIEEPTFIREYNMLSNEYKNNTNALNEGKMYHEKIYSYLSDKIYQEEDLDFS